MFVLGDLSKMTKDLKMIGSPDDHFKVLFDNLNITLALRESLSRHFVKARNKFFKDSGDLNSELVQYSYHVDLFDR